MDLDPQAAPKVQSTSTDVPGGSRQQPKDEAEGDSDTDDEDLSVGDDFDDNVVLCRSMMFFGLYRPFTLP
jgi:hypothetical protein